MEVNMKKLTWTFRKIGTIRLKRDFSKNRDFLKNRDYSKYSQKRSIPILTIFSYLLRIYIISTYNHDIEVNMKKVSTKKLKLIHEHVGTDGLNFNSKK